MRTRSPGAQRQVLLGAEAVQEDAAVQAVSGLPDRVQGKALGRRRFTGSRSRSRSRSRFKKRSSSDRPVVNRAVMKRRLSMVTKALKAWMVVKVSTSWRATMAASMLATTHTTSRPRRPTECNTRRPTARPIPKPIAYFPSPKPRQMQALPRPTRPGAPFRLLILPPPPLP